MAITNVNAGLRLVITTANVADVRAKPSMYKFCESVILCIQCCIRHVGTKNVFLSETTQVLIITIYFIYIYI